METSQDKKSEIYTKKIFNNIQQFRQAVEKASFQKPEYSFVKGNLSNTNCNFDFGIKNTNDKYKKYAQALIEEANKFCSENITSMYQNNTCVAYGNVLSEKTSSIYLLLTSVNVGQTELYCSKFDGHTRILDNWQMDIDICIDPEIVILTKDHHKFSLTWPKHNQTTQYNGREDFVKALQTKFDIIPYRGLFIQNRDDLKNMNLEKNADIAQWGWTVVYYEQNKKATSYQWFRNAFMKNNEKLAEENVSKMVLLSDQGHIFGNDKTDEAKPGMIIIKKVGSTVQINFDILEKYQDYLKFVNFAAIQADYLTIIMSTEPYKSIFQQLIIAKKIIVVDSNFRSSNDFNLTHYNTLPIENFDRHCYKFMQEAAEAEAEADAKAEAEAEAKAKAKAKLGNPAPVQPTKKERGAKLVLKE